MMTLPACIAFDTPGGCRIWLCWYRSIWSSSAVTPVAGHERRVISE